MSSISPTPDATTIETRESVIVPLAGPPLRDYDRGANPVVNDDGTMSIYGWCTPWCSRALDDDQGDNGRTVADHGLWCVTSVGAWVDALYEDGTRERVGVELARPYEHGIYSVPRRRREEVVRLIVGVDQDDDDQRTELHMDPPAARSLAATLLYAADALEGLDRPIQRLAR